MRVLVLMLLAGLMLGCAPKSVPLQEESMNECDRLVKMTERVYLDKNPEEVLSAATRLFQLTGGGYTVTRTADGLAAHRTWLPVAHAKDVPLDGSDAWQLVLKEVTVCTGGPTVGYIEAVEGDPILEVRGRTDDCGVAVPGIRLSVYHIPEIYSQGLIATECFSSPVFKPSVSRFTTTPAVYDLFFLRMDYLLGKSARWPSCASYSEYVRNNIYYRDQFSVLNFQGHLDGLCTQVNDNAP
ncbi:MAG: hypothetical protein FWH34_03540 [Desulfovibrionaceae bacterium]|nr:hypothetical protein [Desulfovibrionaceae bacterium]